MLPFRRSLSRLFCAPFLALALGILGQPAVAASHDSVAPATQAARDAYFSGDIGSALTLAETAGERWIGGLAAFRLKDYALASRRFASLADDARQTEWVRAGAGFWAARAATAGGDEPTAQTYLKLAAAFPHTFYGLIAERRLNPVVAGAPPSAAHPQVFNAQQFPTPELLPKGGFTLSKALVYALVRQESRFNASAIGGGAYGLMQLTPATAARIAGDSRYAHDPRRLHDAALNLRLGQDYVAKLLGSVQGDLLRAMAAYNSGPGILQKLGLKLGDSADTLMMVESMPGGSTRAFVEHVMTSYWIYREIFGLTSPSLDAAAAGSKSIQASLDD